MHDTYDVLLSFVFGTMLGIAIGGFIFGLLSDGDGRTEAIKHGAAHYDGKTGKFTWNNAEATL